MNKDLLNILANSNKDIDNQELMDYLSGNLSGKQLHDVERSMADNAFLNDAVEGLQQMADQKKLQSYVEELNANLQKNMAKKKERRLRRRLQHTPWTYVAIALVILFCLLAYWIIRILLHT